MERLVGADRQQEDRVVAQMLGCPWEEFCRALSQGRGGTDSGGVADGGRSVDAGVVADAGRVTDASAPADEARPR